ncbi:hypothetical protein AXG93_154s1540 [Marchantia polymorpha subsp. ruderalis]|uniref:Uncharacterized protein n=1 Tax=Marchantia polymorpha subsp. ruderalis TaxID=1480154 RepID=A0A176VIH5_MARPO|nr:hypothetical protein AXG93_154s1540 [Marchantia polymorpha subsp. ruderalis]
MRFRADVGGQLKEARLHSLHSDLQVPILGTQRCCMRWYQQPAEKPQGRLAGGHVRQTYGLRGSENAGHNEPSSTPVPVSSLHCMAWGMTVPSIWQARFSDPQRDGDWRRDKCQGSSTDGKQRRASGPVGNSAPHPRNILPLQSSTHGAGAGARAASIVALFSTFGNVATRVSGEAGREGRTNGLGRPPPSQVSLRGPNDMSDRGLGLAITSTEDRRVWEEEAGETDRLKASRFHGTRWLKRLMVLLWLMSSW